MGFANGYITTTSGSLTSGGTSVTVSSTTGIPAVPFLATILGEGANTDEVVLVTANASGTLTLVRAYELVAGNGASAHGSGATFFAGLTAGSVPRYPDLDRLYAQQANQTTSQALTITAIDATKRLILVVGSYNRDVNVPTCTNITFSEVLPVNFASGAFLSCYLGTPTGTSGTTVTITATGVDWIVTDRYVVNDLLSTAGASATLTNTDAASQAYVPFGSVAAAPGAFFITGAAQNDGTTGFGSIGSTGNILAAPRPVNSGMTSAIGRVVAGTITAWVQGGGSGGGDFAAGIVIVT